MAQTRMILIGTAGLLLLAACSSSTKTAAVSQPPVPVAPAAASSSATSSTSATAPPAPPVLTSTPTSEPPAASLSPASSDTGVATTLDPCVLVTSSEASSLGGTSFGAGTEQTSGNAKQCVYGGQTANVFTVEVAQATDAASAQAEFAQEEAEAQAAIKKQAPAGIVVSLDTADVTGLGDKAATIQGGATISGQTINASGIYVLKGATFFAFQDLVLGKSAPTSDALRAEASTVLTRLP